MVMSRELHDMVETGEVGFIGFAEVVVLVIGPSLNKSREGSDSVRSGGGDVVGIIMTGTHHIDPTRGIEAMRLAVGQISLRVMLAQSPHQPLGAISDD